MEGLFYPNCWIELKLKYAEMESVCTKSYRIC